jgi:hypothetical protein
MIRKKYTIFSYQVSHPQFYYFIMRCYKEKNLRTDLFLRHVLQRIYLNKNCVSL